MSEYKLYNDDCLKALKEIDKQIDFVAIDPPYGIDQMNAGWDDEKITNSIKKSNKSVIKNIPVGMKFNPKNAQDLEKFLNRVAKHLFEIMKPGAFCVVFSQPRAAHRVALAFENCDFEIRDQLIWHYGSGQGKAQGMQNFIRKSKSFEDHEKEDLIRAVSGFKTPQLTPCFETMWLMQKPREGTFLNNYLKYNVGLVDFREKSYKVSFNHPKPRKNERKEAGGHPTLKPTSLMEDLVKVFSPQNGTVLDCFAGSGSTGVAAVKLNRKFIGIEKSKKWFEVMRNRMSSLEEALTEQNGE